ncbi:MAG: hypothetical protein A2499_09090 [Stygiobacter sp. RIFOXYC12_FULL_38_8]|nr:MAG: hypothetical protein A2X62_16915 [Stygiobacter sp. GWC2_38_9]OGU77908.1 MAG: hypothetical protein A2279_02865 [Stygiobacter sp. RIFOXYA12_FULL_38_9]OGV09031.1 MAG: hypothetical protein A2299_11410 [Stygiobacter sp. RIFOXYB2_FULL_37_11]OGV16257.1 MAG: hypothetical protein A2440_04315 [Stygiobacter sp. RIFOXYC2_FULL_38_25]OGV28610.1 MAG: hypothetical protein A2499_09090 [Stygiobacter sp. RIFOXYC12_FULL_38_8]OGV81650.1 MAG: hypothetical protein A2X65_15520 [Stygiobacter sp. GWF2_38_21]
MKIFLSASILILAVSGCSILGPSNTVIKIKGSETMVNLTRRLTKEYSKENPNTSFIVEGGGTGAGIISLVANEILISTASRNLEPEEVKLVAERYGTVGVSTSIAKDALCIYVNKANPITNLTTEQLVRIFSGKITNWKMLGFADRTINVYLRNNSSGTLQLFKKLVLKESQFANSAKSYDTIAELQSAVEKNEYSITFSGLVKDTKCKIISIENIEPTNINVVSGYYPLSRYLHFYTLKQPEGEIKIFIDWVLSAKGQKIIDEEGFYSLFNYSLE